MSDFDKALLAWADKQMERWMDEVETWTNVDSVTCATTKFMDKLRDIIVSLKLQRNSGDN